MDHTRETDAVYRRWLDQIIRALQDRRYKDAARVIDNVPDPHIRSFCFYCALHIDRDLDVFKFQARKEMNEILADDRQSSR